MNLDELLTRRVAYTLPQMSRTRVIKDIVYKTVDSVSLKMDVYLPSDITEGMCLPAVVFVHGEAPWELLHSAKDWGQYTSWGQLVAASGMIAITFTHRPSDGFTQLPEAAKDIEDLFQFVQVHAFEYGIDKENLGVWVCSAGGPVGLCPVLHERLTYVKCIAAYYPLLDLQAIEELRKEVSLATIQNYSAVWHLKHSGNPLPPFLLVKAGLDKPVFNEGIDVFATAMIEQNANFDYLCHAQGQHGFDIRDDDSRSREIIQRTLQFFQTNLLGE